MFLVVLIFSGSMKGKIKDAAQRSQSPLAYAAETKGNKRPSTRWDLHDLGTLSFYSEFASSFLWRMPDTVEGGGSEAFSCSVEVVVGVIMVSELGG